MNTKSMRLRYEVAPPPLRSRANMAHLRQSRPDSGLDFQETVLETCHGVFFSLNAVSDENEPCLRSVQGYLAHKEAPPRRTLK